MKHTGRTLVILAMVAATSWTQVDVFVPNGTANAGSVVSEPFGLSSNATAGGWTLIQRIPAAALQSVGLSAGAILQDVAFVPAGTGTMTIGNFRAVVGMTVNPWNSATFLPNLAGATTVWDSASQGPFVWPLTIGQWNVLNPTAIGLTWDGTNDIGIYLTTGASTISSAPPPAGGPVAIWSGSFRTADGTVQRNVAPGFNAAVATSSNLNGLRTRLTFTFAPPTIPGTVTFLPGNTVMPGNGLTVVFSAPSHGGDAYVPFVSCTPGLTMVPGTALTIPLAFDACSSFYYNHTLASIVFPLTPPGSYFGTLSTTGLATGVVFMPASLVPGGLNLAISIAFVTTNFTNVTGVHGPGTFTVL